MEKFWSKTFLGGVGIVIGIILIAATLVLMNQPIDEVGDPYAEMPGNILTLFLGFVAICAGIAMLIS